MTEELGGEFAGFELAQGPAAVTAGSFDLEEPVTLRVHGAGSRFARKEGDTLSIPVTFGFRLGPAYATLSTRRLAVKLPPLGTIEDTFVVKVPPGMQVVSAPAKASGDTRFGSYSVTVENDGGKVVVHGVLTVKVVTVEPAEYAAWKQFAADADAAFTPRLVLGPS